MSISIDRFYRIWNLLQSTPYPVLKDIMAQNAPIYSDTSELYRNVLTNTTVSNGNILDSQGKVLYTGYTGKSWGINPVTNLTYPKDLTIINTAFQARAKSWNFFSNVMIPGSFAYNTPDMDLYRKMLIDWNGAFRTVKDLFSTASDAFTLDDNDVDKAIRGFGIDFINQNSLQNTSLRQAYLLNLCELYKIKGSPQSIIRALELANVMNPIIREYWLERDPSLYKTLRVRGKALGIYEQYLDTNPDPSDPTSNQYVFNNDPNDYPDVLLTMANFEQRLHDIADSHWQYTTNEIVVIEWNADTIIKLPSITPFFGIEFSTLITRYDILISILENIMSGQINTILAGNKNLVPQEIGIGGFNSDLTKKDLWITGYASPLSLVECYLGFVYCQVRYDDWLAFSDLRNFLVSHGVIIDEDTDLSYPWSLQKLIYWAWENKDVYVTPAYTIDSVLKMYIKSKSHYYCSTNELISWWLTLDPLNYWNSSTDNNMDSSLFNIFFSTNYTFQYNANKMDTTLDKILFYTGSRNLDYKNSSFQYFETLNDSDRMLKTPGNRLSFDNEFKSDLPSNYKNNYQSTLFENQDNYQKTFYDYISWVSSNYNDSITHDGSNVQPHYISKYPKNIKWNWAIDSDNIYLNIGSDQWIRTEVETSWPSGEGPSQVFLGANSILGFQCYNNGYAYCNVSIGKWVRYPVITSWDYCESPISPDGYTKLTSDIARQTVVAILDPSIAAIYLSNPEKLSTTSFYIKLSPFSDTPQVIKYTLNQLNTLIDTYSLTVDLYGNVKQDFSFYFHTNSYLYQRLIDSVTNEVLWVKSEFQTNWNTNGTAMYDGGYRYPNLDLTNRYDADRILSGVNVLTASELTDIVTYPSTTNGNGKILVCQGPNGYPETYYFDSISQTWKPTIDNEINNINLGINQGFKDWIDVSVNGDESAYDMIANTLLNNFASYIQHTFQDTTFNIAGTCRDISYSGLYHDIIDFFKPKRARPLYFSTNLDFSDDHLRNSVLVDGRIETTKLLQEVNDYIPRNDSIFISDDISMYQAIYYKDDVTETLVIPNNNTYGTATYYLTGFEDNRCNGFYFHRPDLSTAESNYYLNYHNVTLVNIKNDQPIYGYLNEWVLALRKNAIDWCDALYINYDTDLTSGVWYTQSDSPSTSSSSSSIAYRKVFNTNTLTISNVNDADLNKNIDLTNYQLGKFNQWNTIHKRTEPIVNYTYPNVIIVGGAGSTAVNGKYTYNHSSQRWLKGNGYMINWILGPPVTYYLTFNFGIPLYRSTNGLTGVWQAMTGLENAPVISYDGSITLGQKVLNKSSQSLAQWTPALCVNPFNIRRIFPPVTGDWLGAGFPENVSGERLTGFDADLRNSGTQEFSYPFWKNAYPYSDDQLTIADAPFPAIGFRTGTTSSETLSSSDYIHQYNGIKRGIVSCVVSSGGSGYSSDTVVLINNDGVGHGGELVPVINNGQITSITIVNSGNYLATPIISFYDPTISLSWVSSAPNSSWNSIAMSSDGKYQSATVFGGNIWISNNSGYTWSPVATSLNWMTIKISSDGKYQSANVLGGNIWISNDYGNTWSPVATSLNWMMIAMSSDGKYQSATELNGNIWISNDYGSTWTPVATIKLWISIAMSSDGKYQSATVSGGNIWISNDYGSTWTSTASSKLWGTIAMSSDGKQQSAIVDSANIWISNDYGIIWTSVATSQSWWSIAMSSTGKQQSAVVRGGNIWISDDYGNTWTSTASSKLWIAIAMSSDGKQQSAAVDGESIWLAKLVPGFGASAIVSIATIPLTIPIWWIDDQSTYRTGPIYHRPIYIGIQETIYDCWPCITVAGCTDYYDDGCANFDGPSNPALVIWGTPQQTSSSSSSVEQWLPGQYSEFNIQDLAYDEWTHSNLKTKRFTANLDAIVNPQDPTLDQITVQQFWNNEITWAGELENIGSTYCDTCDTTLFEGDATTIQIPLSWQRCGVYHNTLYGNNFVEAPYDDLCTVTFQPTTTLNSLSEYDFPVGYTGIGYYYGTTTYEMVHVYHRPSGYYYWEIRTSNLGVWSPILRSQLRKKEHTLSDINYLTDQLVVTSNLSVGYNGPLIGTIFINTGNNYVSLDDNDNTWTLDWHIASLSPYITEWTMRNSYVTFYLDISGFNTPIPLPSTFINSGYGGSYGYGIGSFIINSDTPWHVTSDNFLNGNNNDCFNNRWSNTIVDPNTYIGKDVSEITQVIVVGDLYMPTENEAVLCGNIVPFQETFRGIELVYEEAKCHTSVTDSITINISDYVVDAGCSSSSGGCSGDYIKIIGSVPNGYSTRQEHRFIPSEYESMLPTDFNLNSISNLDYYLLKNYLPLYLFQDSPTNTTKLIWDRADSNYYTRVDS